MMIANQKTGPDIVRLIYPLFSILVLVAFDIVWFFNSSLLSSGLPKNNAIGMMIAMVIGCPICLFTVRWVGRIDFNNIWKIFLIWICCGLFAFFFFLFIQNPFLQYFFWIRSVVLFTQSNVILALITWPITIAIFRWVGRLEFDRPLVMRRILVGINVLVILRIIDLLSIKDGLKLGSVVLSSGSSDNPFLWWMTAPLITILIPVFIGFCLLMHKERRWNFSRIEWVFFSLTLINGMIVWTDSAYYTLIAALMLCGFNVFGN